MGEPDALPGLSRRRRRVVVAAGALAVAIVAFVGGIWVDQSFPDVVPPLAFGAAPQGSLDQQSLNQAMRLIRADYYDRNLDYSKLSSGSVGGLVQSLGDPYTRYLDAAAYKREQEGYAGHHSGVIGIYIDFRDGHPVVTGVLPGSPALKAGLRTDDVILGIGGSPTAGLTSAQVSALIEGAQGTTVIVHVSRAGSELDVPVVRSAFQSPTVESYRLPDGLLYMRIFEFGDHTVDEFDRQLKAGLPGSRGVILDLRDNGGGLVTAATAVISRFVVSGEAFEERDRNGHATVTQVDGDHPASRIAVAVLVNGNTASASEIVAGSLQSHHRAMLVGVKTFGKGSVQVDFQLRNGGDLHMTVDHWFLPDGRSINKVGIQPDQPVAFSAADRMFDVVQPDRGFGGDPQLERAMAVLAAA